MYAFYFPSRARAFTLLLLGQSAEWYEILKRSREYDSKMVKDWQDELANLLTFVRPAVFYIRTVH